jgi:DNA (cytosine-5)-methyltransferase 1
MSIAGEITETKTRFKRSSSFMKKIGPAFFDLLMKDASVNLSSYWRKQNQLPNEGAIKVIDMFSGCGGMSTGFRSLNSALPLYEICGAVDIDKLANKSFEANHGLKPLEKDISSLAKSNKELGNFLKETNFHSSETRVLIGCAPCQGFSSHRNTNGDKDSRNGLFLNFIEIAKKVSPEVIVIENVPEILTNQYWPLVSKARKELEKAGYFVNISIHNTAEFGVSQERFRALILAMKKPFKPMEKVFPRGTFRSVKDAIGDLPPVVAGEVHPSDKMHFSAKHSESTLNVIKQVPHDGGNRPPGVGPKCLTRASEKSGKPAYEDVYGRLSWNKPSITITAYARNPASGRFLHPEQNRALTVREASLLQGFPKDYLFEGSLDEKFRQIGNAVPPQFAAALASHIARELFFSDVKEKDFQKGLLESVGNSFSRMIPGLKRQQVINQ